LNPAEQRRLAFILGTVMSLGPTAVDMYLPALPTIARGLGTDLGRVQLTLATFFVGLSLGQLLWGPLADRYGRRGPMLAGLALFTLSSAACAMTTSVDALIVMRFFQAVGSSCGMVIVLAIVRDCFPPEGAARMLSRLMLIMGVAPVFAPLLGGQVLAWFGWRAIFWFVTIAGAACFVSIALQLKETRPADTHVPKNLFAVFAGFIAILGHRRFVGYALTRGSAYGGMFALITGSPFVFIEFFGVPPQYFGWVFGAAAATMIASSQLNGPLLRRFSPEQLLGRTMVVTLTAGLLLVAAALLFSGFGLWGLLAIMIPQLFYSATLGLVQPLAASQAMAPFGTRAGAASSMFGCLSFMMAALASSSVSFFHNGGILPMTGTIAAAGLLAFLAHHVLARPRASDAGATAAH
jgi:DHA1 family bicyclomycin/chloramphenicol resistance-like MFS transporter